MSDTVADASAVLALLFNEPGAAIVQRAFAEGRVFMSAINEAEVLSKLVDRGYDSAGAAALLSQLSVVSVPFDSVLAEATAALRTPTRPLGLSLADRACLALSAQLGLRALTADRAWERVELLVPVVVIR